MDNFKLKPLVDQFVTLPLGSAPNSLLFFDKCFFTQGRYACDKTIEIYTTIEGHPVSLNRGLTIGGGVQWQLEIIYAKVIKSSPATWAR